MKQISEIDVNFKVDTHIQRDNLQFYNAATEPFRIYGLLRENGRYCRMPMEIAYQVNDGVKALSTNTAGGRVRFRTNSPYIAISTQMDGIGKMPHFPLTGSVGFDLYADEGSGATYRGTFTPPFTIEDGYEGVIDFVDARERVITIHFPLYSNVKELYIGLDSKASLAAAPDYAYEKPVVYYGSSITQGGCASRPGNSYQNIISRRLDMDHVNLGFSGSGRAEPVMAEYLAGLDMSVFVCDYDHNAPDREYLEKTHLPLYRMIRAKQPQLPIIFISAPDVLIKPETHVDRREVIQRTYETAIEEGDQNVYFIDGGELFAGEDWDLCTVDGTHPNDLGFYRMAIRIEKEIKKILK